METIDLSLIVAGGVGSAFSVFVINQPDPPRWRGGILFDEAVGDLLFAETDLGRERGQLISDIGYFTILFAVPLVDSSVAWLYHDQPDVAVQMLGIYAESIAITGLFANLLPRIIGRERPLIGEECYRNPELEGCPGRAAVSFPSGHTAMVIAGASTMFVQHAFLPVYGEGAGEVIALTLASTAALGTSVARITSQKHHATDVIAGALLGAGIGTAVPYLMHYQPPNRRRGPVGEWSAGPYVNTESAGWRISYQW